MKIKFPHEVVYVFGILAVFIFGFYAKLKWQCDSYEMVTGKQTKVVAMSCYVKHESRFMLFSEYKAYITASSNKEG